MADAEEGEKAFGLLCLGWVAEEARRFARVVVRTSDRWVAVHHVIEAEYGGLLRGERDELLASTR